METSQIRKRMPVSALLDPKIVVPAIGQAFVKLDPRTLIKNPVMFVLEMVTALDHGHSGSRSRYRRRAYRLRVPDHRVAVVHRAVRQFRGGDRRGPRQGAGRGLAAHAHRNQGQAAERLRPQKLQADPEHHAQGRRHRPGRSRRSDPVRRRDHRRRRLGQRSGDHRRIGAGHPRVGRRPFRRHRRHAGAVRLDPRAHHRGAGLDLPRSHDQAGGRRRAAEDAERDRAQHPARRPDDHLRVRDGDDPELRRLCRRFDLRGDPGRAVRDADPDHHRRAFVGDRHRRHGPSRALQRAGHVGPRGRGGGRRRHAAARQDRHHHARQPAGDRVQAGARRDRAGIGGCGAARLARRRNAGRPLDRGAGEGEIWHPRARARRNARQIHPVHRAEPHERRGGRRFVGAQRRRRRDPQVS